MIWVWRFFHNYDAAKMSHPEQTAGNGEQTSLSSAGVESLYLHFFLRACPGDLCLFSKLSYQFAFIYIHAHYNLPCISNSLMSLFFLSPTFLGHKMTHDFNVAKVIDTFSSVSLVRCWLRPLLLSLFVSFKTLQVSIKEAGL